ncbi:peptidase A4 family-domain-containing protein [Boletus reticuloceps]|uniref:Peptidase A4 family-domain-containing protein n=1 Tax=Boletus reticuloceps TaxID=495285 RepID=A0A8I2YVN7_9AGAM|nr:peptidase A4 family-domain-containing protein [Boletus reticuloceps]
MHFSSLLISSFLLAPAVLAEHPREFRRSLLDLVEKRTDAVSDVKVTTNLAGAVWLQDDGTFYSVSGTLTIPKLSGQDGSIGTAFVGIDYSLYRFQSAFSCQGSVHAVFFFFRVFVSRRCQINLYQPLSLAARSFLLVSVGLTDCRRTDRQSRPYSGVERLTNVRSENSTNWAGAILEKDNGTFFSVIGTFTIPEISGSSQPGLQATAAAWIGLDGRGTCSDALLQAGVSLTATSSGPFYQAWYEWWPDPSNYFTGLTFSPGDVIGLVVGAPVNNTYGLVLIANLNNGQVAIETLSSTHALCGQSAEWIVEGFLEDAGSFPNFSPVEFTKALAHTHGGQTYRPQDATISEIVFGNEVRTSVSVSGDSVTIKHV